MLGSILGTVLTGSPKIGGFVSQGMLYSDQAYDEEIAAGASHDEAMWAAGLTGLITGVLGSYQTSGWARFGQSFTMASLLKSAREKGMKRIARLGTHFTYDMLKGALQSSIQEALQEATVAFTPTLLRGKEVDWQMAKQRIWRAGMGGGVAFFAAGPVTSFISIRQQAKAAHQINQNISSFVDSVTTYDPTTALDFDTVVKQVVDAENNLTWTDAVKRTFHKRFNAKLTIIRNNAESVLANAPNSRQRLGEMQQSLSEIQQHYQNIKQDIEAHPEWFGELQKIDELLPQLSKAVKGFSSRPTTEMLQTIRTLVDTINELGQIYANNVEVVRATPERRQQMLEDAALERWVRGRMESVTHTKESAEAGDTNAQIRMQELLRDFPPPQRAEVEKLAGWGDAEAAVMLQNEEYAGGANEYLASARQQAKQEMPTFQALLERANAGDVEAAHLVEQTRYPIEKDAGAMTQDVDDPRIPDRNSVEGASQHAKDLRGKVHQLARKLKMSEPTRRAVMEKITNKRSTTEMNVNELNAVVEHLSRLANEKGVSHSITDDIINILKDRPSRYKTNNLLPGQIRNGWKGWIDKAKKAVDIYWDGQKRVERLLSAIDGYQDGPLYNTIWNPINESGFQAIEGQLFAQKKFIAQVHKIYGDNIGDLLAGNREVIIPATETHPAVSLNPTERLAFYIYSKNKNGLNHLLKGNLANVADPETALVRILDSVTDKERLLGDTILAELDSQYDSLNQVYQRVFGKPLGKDEFYFPIRLEGVDVGKHPTALQQLLSKARNTEYQHEPSFAKARKKGAAQPLRLDILSTYMNHLNQTQQFLHVAPAVDAVSKILGNKQVRRELARTQGDHVVRMMDKWLEDSARGHASQMDGYVQKSLMALREHGIVYALGYNVPSVMRQTLSNLNAMAVHPAVLSAYAQNLAAYAHGNHKNIHDFVYDKSRLIRTRSPDEAIVAMERYASPEMKIRGKLPWSSKVLAWIKWSDRETTVLAWKAFYDAAMSSEAVAKQYGLDGSEAAAIKFADKMVSRTQPMSQVHHLPDFFRGGVMERMLSTFENQVNNNLQFWTHDVLGEYRAGKITPQMAAYRVLFSHVMPSQLFGLIGRGRLPESWKEAGMDALAYGLSTPFLVGRILVNVLQGQYGMSPIETSAFHHGGVAISNLMKGELSKAALSAGRSFGAGTGRIPAQFFRTGKGAYRLFDGTTDDLRELIWSDYTLQSFKKDKDDLPLVWQTRR